MLTINSQEDTRLKTDGQILYEAKHPKRVHVVLYSDHFRQSPFWAENPEFHAPWRLLTERCRQSWEMNAKGHNLVLSARSREVSR